MKKRTFVVLLVLAVAALTSPTAYSADGDSWSSWGVEPYASGQTEACRKAPDAIDGFSMPSEVKSYFKTVIGTGCPGGRQTWLTPNMMLEQMWSGGSRPQVMNKKEVGELPVLKSSDGRPYRRGSVAQTAKALSWAAVYEGKTYIIYLPLVCFNWSWAFGADPPTSPSVPQALAAAVAKEKKCATITFVVQPGDEIRVQPGDEVRFAVFARQRLPASACWQLCDGKKCSAPPSACDDCDWAEPNGPKSVIPDELEPVHTGSYIATESNQSIRFPREVESSYVALCVLRSGLGESDTWVVQPGVWDSIVTNISIPYGGQKWPVWGQYDSSK